MHSIHKKYNYNHVHNGTLLQFILKELAGDNSVCILKDTQLTGTGTMHLVAESVSYLQAMMGEDTDSAHTNLVYGVSSNSNLSEEEHKPRARESKKSQCSKLRSGHGKKKVKDNKPKKNSCPHCKKFHCKKPHWVKPNKCMRNKKNKGYRFKLICNELKVAFKPCHNFAAKLGGYASKDIKSGDDWRRAGMPADEEKDGKWITVTGNSKTKNLLNPKPKSKPKLHNAFAILSQPNAPTHCNTPSPKQQMDNNKTIMPPGPQEHRKQQKIARRQHIKRTLQPLRESDDLFLDNSITQAEDECTAITKNNTNNAKRVAFDSAHAQCN
jgi:hypothetical protein